MPAAITEFVDVTISLSSASAGQTNFGTLLGVFEHSIGADRQAGPFVSTAEAVDAGFTLAAEPEVYAWVQSALSQERGVNQVVVGREDAADATLTATLDAVAAEDSDWYITNLESRAAADILAGAAWTEAQEKILIAQSSDAGILAGTAANVALTLQAAAYNRTALIYHATNGEYLDGAWSSVGGGLDLDAPDGAGIWAFQEIAGVPFDALTSAQAGEVFEANANIYGRTRKLSFTSKGRMASGRFIDVTTTRDWLKARSEEAILSRFVSTPTKVPFTNGGIGILKADVQGVLDAGVTNGHLSPDAPHYVTAPDVSEISEADKLAGELKMQAVATLAGGVIKVVYNITVKN